MGYAIDRDGFSRILERLADAYDVYAPRRARGGAGEVRYGRVRTPEEMALSERSAFSPKEVVFPIVQTLLYFRDSEYTASETDGRSVLLFARACDINGLARLDTVMLKNAGVEDAWYKRLREKVKLCLIECTEGWDECFCVSMGANTADGYAAAVRFEGDGALFEVRDDALLPYFAGERAAAFSPSFVQQNKRTVRLPLINDELLRPVAELDYWRQFDDKCVGCGACNAVCPGCSCFDTVDVVYHQTSLDGERRRVWSSCMTEAFTTMAGGHCVRSSPGARMRFKTMHKIYGFQKRFGQPHPMCVGCGRCVVRCPQEIRFSDTVDGLYAEVEALRAGKEERT